MNKFDMKNDDDELSRFPIWIADNFVQLRTLKDLKNMKLESRIVIDSISPQFSTKKEDWSVIIPLKL